MGRSFASIRQRANGIAERWSLAVRALKRDDREHGRHQVALAKQHVSESFVACNNPLEAVVFSILVELLKDREETGSEEGEQCGSLTQLTGTAVSISGQKTER